MDRDDVIETLNDLIETCKDGEHGFRASAEHMKDDQIRQNFLRRAEECRIGAAELQALVTSLGGRPDEGGSASAAVHRGWVAVKGRLGGWSDGAILEETERGEDAALARYRKALDEALPPDVRTLVLRQYDGVLRNHAIGRKTTAHARPRAFQLPKTALSCRRSCATL